MLNFQVRMGEKYAEETQKNINKFFIISKSIQTYENGIKFYKECINYEVTPVNSRIRILR